MPERFEHGTLSFELLAGVTGAVEHLAALTDATGSRRERVLASLAAAQAYEVSLFARLVAGLSAIDGVVMAPAPEDRCPTVAFHVTGQEPALTALRLGDEGVCVFAGDYYAYEYFQATQPGGAVRASIYHYLTESDVERLLDAVRRAAASR